MHSAAEKTAYRLTGHKMAAVPVPKTSSSFPARAVSMISCKVISRSETVTFQSAGIPSSFSSDPAACLRKSARTESRYTGVSIAA